MCKILCISKLFIFLTFSISICKACSSSCSFATYAFAFFNITTFGALSLLSISGTTARRQSNFRFNSSLLFLSKSLWETRTCVVGLRERPAETSSISALRDRLLGGSSESVPELEAPLGDACGVFVANFFGFSVAFGCTRSEVFAPTLVDCLVGRSWTLTTSISSSTKRGEDNLVHLYEERH